MLSGFTRCVHPLPKIPRRETPSTCSLGFHMEIIINQSHIIKKGINLQANVYRKLPTFTKHTNKSKQTRNRNHNQTLNKPRLTKRNRST